MYQTFEKWLKSAMCSEILNDMNVNKDHKSRTVPTNFLKMFRIYLNSLLTELKREFK